MQPRETPSLERERSHVLPGHSYFLHNVFQRVTASLETPLEKELPALPAPVYPSVIRARFEEWSVAYVL